MADLLNPFCSNGGDSFCGAAKQEDPRGRFIILFFTPFPVFSAGPAVLAVYTLIHFWALGRTGILPLRFLSAARGFCFLLLFFCLAGFLQDTFSTAGFTPGEHGSLGTAVLLSFRLFILFQAGILYLRMVSPGNIRRSASWFASFIPGFPVKKTGLLFSLTLGTLPSLLALWETIRNAQKTRGMENVKNPVKRLTAPLFPLLLTSLLQTRLTGDALLARGYALEEENPPGGSLKKSRNQKSRRLRAELLPPWSRKASVRLLSGILLMAVPLTAEKLVPFFL